MFGLCFFFLKKFKIILEIKNKNKIYFRSFLKKMKEIIAGLFGWGKLWFSALVH